MISVNVYYAPWLRGTQGGGWLADVNRILVMRGGAIGDFVLTLPAIHALQAAYPEAEMTLVADPGIGALSGIDDIFDHGSASLASLYVNSGEILPIVQNLFEDVDLAVVYSTDRRTLRSSLVWAATGAARTTGSRTPSPWKPGESNRREEDRKAVQPSSWLRRTRWRSSRCWPLP